MLTSNSSSSEPDVYLLASPWWCAVAVDEAPPPGEDAPPPDSDLPPEAPPPSGTVSDFCESNRGRKDEASGTIVLQRLTDAFRVEYMAHAQNSFVSSSKFGPNGSSSHLLTLRV